jgi:DNA-binding YbaB/EbfC family protein
MFKGLGNFASMMKQAQGIQDRMSKLQEEMGQLRVEASAGGGMVRVEANGQQKILAIQLEDSLLENPDREMLEDLLVAATNQALDKSREAAAEEMAKLTGNLDIPGLGDALSQMGLDMPGSGPNAGS